MSGTAAPALGELRGFELGSTVVEYSPRDAILHALAVGAGAEDLEMVYEQRLATLPTFAMPLGLWAVDVAGGLGAYDAQSTLHVGQDLVVHRSLPRECRFQIAARIGDVWDKGSAALVDVCVSSELFDATYTIYVPGAGGFGGERGQSAPAIVPGAPPDLRAEVRTWESQPALYRLTGDLHPLHIDPGVARANGFDRPILHGLCTLGAVVLAVGRAVGSPTALRSLSARFAAPVYPGDTIDVCGWRDGESIAFAAAAGATDVLKGAVRL